MEPDEGEQPISEQKHLRAHMPQDTQLEDKERKISAGFKKLF